MAREYTIKPCPICLIPMTVRKTCAVVEGGYRKWFFFLYCNQCGYGPNNAFDTIYQAIKDWNSTALASGSKAQMALKADYNNLYPRWFH